MISCVCPTYKRPVQLANVIRCFLDQTHLDKELIILDDAQQYPDGLSGDRWRIVSWPHRFETLGEKRNKVVELAKGDYIAVWDDDDVYLPWHLEALVTALSIGDLVIPSYLWIEKQERFVLKHNDRSLFHGAWAFSRELFNRAGGYPLMQSGQDQGFLQRAREVGYRRSDSLWFDSRPSYAYRWHTIPGHQHISAGGLLPEMKEERYTKTFAEIPMELQANIQPHYEKNWMEMFNAASA